MVPFSERKTSGKMLNTSASKGPSHLLRCERKANDLRSQLDHSLSEKRWQTAPRVLVNVYKSSPLGRKTGLAAN